MNISFFFLLSDKHLCLALFSVTCGNMICVTHATANFVTSYMVHNPRLDF